MKIKKLVSASWCGPCQTLKRTISQSGLAVEIIDIDIDPAFAKEHSIRSIPTLVVIKGDEVEYVRGVENILKELANNNNDNDEV